MNAPANGWSNAPGPVQEHERVDTVDVLRGFALFGILLVNVGFFAHPVSEPFYIASDASAADRAAHRLVAMFAQGKFYPLFSLLFGLGFSLQLQRACARRQPLEKIYMRRLFVLLVIGLLHGVFIWAGDILLAYAVLGFFLLLFSSLSARGLLGAAITVYVLQLLLLAAFTFALTGLYANPGATEDALTRLTAGMNEAAALRADAWAAYASGSYFEVTAVRVREYAMALQNMAFFALQVLGMFLLGAWLGRCGILVHPLRHRRLLKSFLVVGVVVGLPLSMVFATINERIDYLGKPTPDMGYAFLLNLVAGLLFALAWVAAVTLLMQTNAARWLRVLAPVGRMALTNYLLQSLICTTLFYSYGFGWFGEPGNAELTGVVVAVFAVQLVFSSLWIRHLRFGPVEWLWRSLVYLHWQPMRRSTSESLISRPMSGWQKRS